MSRVLIAGGYGVFGSQLARELSSANIPLTLAGRNAAKAQDLAKKLGPEHHGIALDVRDPDSCQSVLTGHSIVVHCAGPFSRNNTALIEACLRSRCHYVDIADDRGYIAALRGLSSRFQDAGLTAAYGCSSLPGISGALALSLAPRASSCHELRVTLFIGNRNPKGGAAIASLFKILGRPIATAEGTILGFGDPEKVQLPSPWGEREVYNFESPEYDLFPEQKICDQIRVKVGFESRAVNLGLARLAGWPETAKKYLQRPLQIVGNFLNGWGHSGGVVQVERWDEDGAVRRAALFSMEQGQRMAILPGAEVVKALLQKIRPSWAGAKTVYDILDADMLLTGLVNKGFFLLKS